MTRIDHAALYVADLETARDFFVTWFGATANEGYHNPRTGLRTHFLSFEGDAKLEIMTRPGIERAREEGLLGWAHVALDVGSPQAVDDLAARLTEAGFQVINGPRTTGDGYYEAVVLEPEGNEVEIIG